MSKIHSNAGLSLSQRKLVQDLYREGHKISELARRFGVNRKTIERWVKRDSVADKASGPKNPRSVITPAYKAAIIAHRQAHPDHGPITIAFHLRPKFNFANRGTVLKILQQEKLTAKARSRAKSEKN